jgi:hypothetical protein
MAAESGREKQAAEADEIAIKLLEAAGFAPRELALNLALGPTESQLGNTSWAKAFGVSARNLMARVRGRQDLPPVAANPQQPDAAAPAPPMVASPDAPLRAAPSVRLPVNDIVMRTRPSGMPGQLELGGRLLPARRIE